jgi:hypothetical protein
MNSKYRKLIEELPELGEELIQLLKARGDDDLVSQISELLIVDRCRCEDDFCSSIYTAPPPKGAYGPGHEKILLDAEKGMIVLDLVKRKIMFIEVLWRDDIHNIVLSILP